MNKRLIYEEDAIDALKKAYWDRIIQSAKDDPCIVDAMTDWAIRQIKALPSAQPVVTDEAVKEYCDKRGLIIVKMEKYISMFLEKKGKNR